MPAPKDPVKALAWRAKLKILNKNKKPSEANRKATSEYMKKKWQDETYRVDMINQIKKSHNTDSYKAKMSLLNVGRVSQFKGKTYEQIYGSENVVEQINKRKYIRTEEIRRKMSLGHTYEIRKIVSEKLKGRKVLPESIEKRRITMYEINPFIFITCKNCKKIIKTKRKVQQFCDRKCWNEGFKHSLESLKKISETSKGRKGFYMGKHLLESTKEKIRQKLKGKKLPTEVIEKIKATRIERKARGLYIESFKKISIAAKENASKRFIEGKFTHYSNCKKGYYKGIFYRSGWEQKTMQYFDLNNIKWLYENERFWLGELDCYYIPDFYLPEKKLYVEVKGRYDNMNKIECFKKEYSNKTIEVWNQVKLKELKIIE